MAYIFHVCYIASPLIYTFSTFAVGLIAPYCSYFLYCPCEWSSARSVRFTQFMYLLEHELYRYQRADNWVLAIWRLASDCSDNCPTSPTRDRVRRTTIPEAQQPPSIASATAGDFHLSQVLHDQLPLVLRLPPVLPTPTQSRSPRPEVDSSAR